MIRRFSVLYAGVGGQLFQEYNARIHNDSQAVRNIRRRRRTGFTGPKNQNLRLLQGVPQYTQAEADSSHRTNKSESKIISRSSAIYAAGGGQLSQD